MGQVISHNQLLLSLGVFLMFLLAAAPLIISAEHFREKMTEPHSYHYCPILLALRQPHVGNYQRRREVTEKLL